MTAHTAPFHRALGNVDKERFISGKTDLQSVLYGMKTTLVGTLAAVFMLVGAASLPAQTAAADTHPAKSYMNKDRITLPILIDNRRRAHLRELLLFVKSNPQHPWRLAQKASPMQREFLFDAPADGEYLFTVVTVDKSGRSNLRDLDKIPPQRVLVIDRQPPRFDVRVLPKVADGQPVECHFFDANPVPASLHLEYQTGDGNWREMQLVAGGTDTWLIPRQAAHNGKIRISATDRCRNSVTKVLHLSECPGALDVAANSRRAQRQDKQTPLPMPPSRGPQLPPSPYSGKDGSVAPADYKLPRPGPQHTPTPPLTQARYSPPLNLKKAAPGGNLPVQLNQAPMLPQLAGENRRTDAQAVAGQGAHRVVANPRMSVDYQIEKASDIGVGKVEIWVTQDQGRNWRRLATDPDKKSPAEVVLPGEGLYGLRLVATNGYGFGGEPPSPGQAPEWFVEVDMTKPVARLLSVEPIKGDRPGALLIQWSAVDKNLAAAPIGLEYAAAPSGPWTPIAGNLENNGQYRWEAPSSVRGRVYVRLTAVDRAGNSVQTSSQQAIQVDDFSRPVVRIRGIRE